VMHQKHKKTEPTTSTYWQVVYKTFLPFFNHTMYYK
jgi:hypothetical protein